MKTPSELRTFFQRQWKTAATREACLLNAADAWPIVAQIGPPKPKELAGNIDKVKRHVEGWRRIKIGEVLWEKVRYRATLEPVEVPVAWKVRDAAEWVNVCEDRSIQAEFDSISVFLQQADSQFHPLLIRSPWLWREKSTRETLQAIQLALALQPLCANNKPLRTLPLEGIDTKFFERNSRLMTALLDVRFDGEVGVIGLEAFLGAVSEEDHWLLVIDLDGSLLPFRKQRVRSSEIKDRPLPGNKILIVENESCQHHLPNVPETVAVLGTGFDLEWLNGRWLQSRRVAYWGDIDTWGLQFLATARRSLPHLEALLMTQEIYNQNTHVSVPEPIVAGSDTPAGLKCVEQSLYKQILNEPRGRLEQEFLPESVVRDAINNWCDC